MLGKNNNFPSSFIIYLLAIMYLITGISKLIGANTQVENFENWGFSTGFMITIGIVEILGTIALLIPKTRFVAVLGLATLMIGAVGTHLINGEYLNSLLPLVLLALLVFEIFRNRGSIEEANLTEGDQANY